MAVTIRPAGPDDSDAVKRMLAEFIDYLDAIEPSEGEADLDYLIEQAFGPDPVCKTMIAECDGVPVGYVSFHPGIWEIWRSIYVISLFVSAAARGHRRRPGPDGRGQRRCPCAAPKRIVWEVWSKNPLAIDFYKSIGGEVFEENSADEPGGQMIEVHRSTPIAAPAKRVWALLRDFNAMPEWNATIRKSVIENGPAHRIGVPPGSDLRRRQRLDPRANRPLRCGDDHRLYDRRDAAGDPNTHARLPRRHPGRAGGRGRSVPRHLARDDGNGMEGGRARARRAPYLKPVLDGTEGAGLGASGSKSSERRQVEDQVSLGVPCRDRHEAAILRQLDGKVDRRLGLVVGRNNNVAHQAIELTPLILR